MYYSIEVINNLNIEFIVIFVNIAHYLTHNDADILILSSGPDYNFPWI